MPRAISRLKEDEDYLQRLRRAFSTTKLGAGGVSDLSRLLADPTEFGMTRSPAHTLRAKRLAERIRTIPVMGPTDGPAAPGQVVGAPTAVREGGFLKENVHAISSALGQAGQAVMGEHQDTWQARLGATTQQIAESRAYQETVSGLLGGTAIEDIPAARALRPEQFQAAMVMKAETDKAQFDKEDRLFKRQRDLDKDLKAGLIDERDYKQRLEEFRATLGLETKRVAASELQAKTAASREAKVPTPEEETRLRLDFEKGREEILASGKKEARQEEQYFRLFSKLIADEYTPEEAMDIVNAYAGRVEAKPAEGESVGLREKVIPKEVGKTFENPTPIKSRRELDEGETNRYYMLEDGTILRKRDDGYVERLDSSGRVVELYPPKEPERRNIVRRMTEEPEPEPVTVKVR